MDDSIETLDVSFQQDIENMMLVSSVFKLSELLVTAIKVRVRGLSPAQSGFRHLTGRNCAQADKRSGVLCMGCLECIKSYAPRSIKHQK